ncbi:MAG: SusC/RagA family TonB-linked outer membrane protein [Tannerellaceae bacterium]
MNIMNNYSFAAITEQYLRNERNFRKFKSILFATLLAPTIAIASPETSNEVTPMTTSSAVTQQQRTIKGSVIDGMGEPLIGVSISLKGTRVGTVTDFDGNFSINAKTGDVLVLSYVGFAPQEVKVGNKDQYKITLQEDTKRLEEVVITGALGIRKQEPKMGYAVTQVKGDELARVNAVNPITALQGKVAGVSVNTMGTSGVQTSPNIVIRGAKSLGNNSQPIFVVDGMILENPPSNEQGEDWGSQLKNLNPDDYESMTVLKGAAATALYGSRGANGAVVINTKSGGKRQGLGIDFSHTQQFETMYKNHIEMQDVYGMGYWGNFEGGYNEAGIVPFSANSWGMKMEGQLVNVPWTNTKMPMVAQPNNWKTFYQTGHYMNTNVALNGGTDKVAYRVSYSNTSSDGVLPNNGLDRNAFAVKASGELNKIFRVDAGFNFSRTDVQNAANQGRWADGNFGRALAYSLPRNIDLAEWKKNYRNDDNSLKKYPDYSLFDEIGSIFHRMDYKNTTRTEDSYLANIMLTAQVLPWLDFSAKANYNFYKIFGETKEWGTGTDFKGGLFSQNGSNKNEYNFLFSAHANRKYLDDRFDVDVRLFSEIYGTGQKEDWGKSTAGGLLVPGFFSFSNSVGEVRPTVNTRYPDTKVIGLGAAINLGWKDQVNLEITGRNDWSSTLLYTKSNPFGKNNYSIFYPSANLSWIFTESFRDQMPEWFSFGKLRGSVSRVGYGTSAYATNGTWGYWQGSIYDENGNSVITGGVQGLDQLQNFDIKPETQQEIEVGFDTRFVDNRFGIDFAYYKKNTFNQILTIPNTPESGAANKWINAGNIQNQGIELLIDARPIVNKNFRWDMTFNFTRNRGKIIEFHPGVSEFQLMGNYEGAEVWAYEGGEFGVMTATSTRGKYQAYDNQGNQIDDPRNGKYVVTLASDKQTFGHVTEGTLHDRWRSDYNKIEEVDAYKRTELGQVQPKFFFGHTQSFYYKGFDLNVQIDGRVGGVVYSSSYALGMSRGNLAETLKYRDQWSGGLERIGTDGNTYYNGVIPDVIFDRNTVVKSNTTNENVDLSGMSFQEAVDAGHLSPIHAGAYYQSTYGWSKNLDTSVFDNTWVALREISLGYTLPRAISSKFYVQNLRLGFAARNLCYIYNGLKGGLNPEAIQSNRIMSPVEYGATPYSRNFSFSINVTL